MTQTAKKARRVLYLMALAGLLIYNGAIMAAGISNWVTPIGADVGDWRIKGNPFRNKWVIGEALVDPQDPRKLIVTENSSGYPQLINAAKGDADIYTRDLFGDCTIELELMVPKGSNSGIYLMGQYEIQVKDSYSKGRHIGSKEMGAICGYAKPRLNASKPAGTWQKMVIEFKAPRFKQGKKVAPAEFLKISLNDQVIHQNLKMHKGASPGP